MAAELNRHTSRSLDHQAFKKLTLGSNKNKNRALLDKALRHDQTSGPPKINLSRELRIRQEL